MFPQAVRRWTYVLGVGLILATPAPSTAVDEEVALQCRFSSGMAAIYLFSRSKARVRRADLLQPREGQVRVTGAEYRFIFRERASAYRIDVIIDRATGNARRVFGTRENMERMSARGDQGSGLVYEAGQCRAQHASLR
jgi:hypothetical protein